MDELLQNDFADDEQRLGKARPSLGGTLHWREN